MRFPVKVCGNTRLEDARLACELGAWAVGFIFYAKSPRNIEPDAAKAIIRELPPYVTAVGVFVDERPEVINAIARECRLDRIQLHVTEPYEFMGRLDRSAYRVFHLRGEGGVETLAAEPDATVLLDTYDPGAPGGTGRTFNWDWARRAAQSKRVILAGGLEPGNVAEAIAEARPYAVDAVSGLESAPGIKDPAKLEAFFRAVSALSVFPSPLDKDHASAS